MADRYSLKAIKTVDSIPVPENLQKKIKRNAELIQKKRYLLEQKKKKFRKIRHDLKMREYKYNSLYRKQSQEVINRKREARSKGGFYKEAEAKVVFAVRIKGINKLAPKPKMILRLFRLRQLHNGVFLKLNNATMEMLTAVQPFIAYGYLSLGNIRKLIYKRGYGKVIVNRSKSRVRLTDNRIISESLGKYNIHGVEDIIYQLHTCGPYFKQVSNFLWPFKLSSPRKGFVSKRHGFNEPRGGDWGNREKLMNDLVKRML